MRTSGFAEALREVRGRRKLSQLELALRADTSQRYVSFLERGRSVPGREMVIRLGEALELPLRERNDLLLTAGYAPAYRESGLHDPLLRPVIGALRHILHGHLPFPAVVINRHGVLIAANSALDVLTDGIQPRLLEDPVNIYRLALHPDGIAPRIGNLAEWSRRIIHRVHQESLRDADPALSTLLTELQGYAAIPVSEPTPVDLGFAVPLRLRSTYGELRLITTITTFSSASDVTLAELKLEAFLPADDATAVVLSRLNDRRESRRTRRPAAASRPG